jgi:hypothetical protein
MRTRLVFAAAALTAAAAFLTGCETPLPPGAEPGPHGTMAYNVLIEASEPGARIEANGQNIGNTPVHLKIFGDRDGTFHDFGSYDYVVQAFPLVTNQFPQTRVFRTGHLLTPEDHIPSRIFFDMTQPPQPPAYPAYAPGYYPPPPYYYPPYYYYGPRIYIHGYHHW